MTYFSLLSPAKVDDGNYDVEDLHINVWSLPGLFWHRPMLIDVGVRLSASHDCPVRAIEVVIPARVVKQLDLSQQVLNTANGRLIFGRHFSSADGNSITLKDLGRIPVVSATEITDVKKLTVVEGDNELTALRVDIQQVEAGTQAYVRVRFIADGTTSLLRWQRVIGRRGGATVDLRVPDPREGGREVATRAKIRDRDKPIGQLEAFFMLPERFQLSGVNPSLKYTRTLEGKRWEDYLRRSPTGLLRRERILVHRWRDENVGGDRPFRGYLQVQRVPNFRPLTDTLLSAALVALLLYALFRPFELRDIPSDVVVAAWRLARAEIISGLSAVVPVSIVAAVAFVWAVVSKLGKGLRAFPTLKRAFKRVEYEYFRLLGK